MTLLLTATRNDPNLSTTTRAIMFRGFTRWNHQWQPKQGPKDAQKEEDCGQCTTIRSIVNTGHHGFMAVRTGHVNRRPARREKENMRGSVCPSFFPLKAAAKERLNPYIPSQYNPLIGTNTRQNHGITSGNMNHTGSGNRNGFVICHCRHDLIVGLLCGFNFHGCRDSWCHFCDLCCCIDGYCCRRWCCCSCCCCRLGFCRSCR
mmetsp:Transcript_5818/g.12936  ORF Transcript_5818/g.12936 Transcript_5818/m.12936 type:complete len:204 (-) Transcript_5818:220-831(-)